MFGFIKKLFGIQATETKAVEEKAPYKVETPVAFGEPPATVVVEGAGVVEAPVAAKPAKTKKASGGRKPAAPKSADKTAKKPRKPKAPKAPKA